MDSHLSEALNYLSSPAGSFWKWMDDGKVVAWNHGATIGFREEIAAVLRNQLSRGLPPIDSVLLLIAATRQDWFDDSMALMTKLAENSGSSLTMNDLIERLMRIHDLPDALIRSLDAKVALVDAVFEFTPPAMTGRGAEVVCDILAHGLVPELRVIPSLPRLRGGRVQHSKSLCSELASLSRELEGITEQSLRLRLQTGLEETPLPADVVVPVSPDDIGPLLQQLAGDDELYGLSRIARNLSAVLHLPRTLSDADELALGGVSDISNRGTLERLLLSELAHDDLMLATRVALNEALYLRREAPPSPPPQRRHVLVDSGLRMWGVPRVYAAAAMLSIAASATEGTTSLAYRAAGSKVEPIDLSTRAGLVAHLEALESEVHPGQALPAFFHAVQADEQAGEAIVITSEEAFADPELRRALAAASSSHCYVGTVGREGEFELWSRGPRGAKRIASLKLDLDELLKPPTRPKSRLVDPELDPNLPAILRTSPFPIRLPYQLSQNVEKQTIWSVRLPEQRAQREAKRTRPDEDSPSRPAYPAVILTRDRRLLLFDKPQRGAIQIADSVPFGKCLWSGSLGDYNLSYALIHRPSEPAIYLIVFNVVMKKLIGVRKLCSPFLSHSGPGSLVLGATYKAGFLYVVYRSKVEVFEMIKGAWICELDLNSWTNWRGGRYFINERTDRDAGWEMLTYDGDRLQLMPILSSSHKSNGLILRLFDRLGEDGPLAVMQRGSIANLSNQSEWQWTTNPRCNPQLLDVSDDGERLLIEQDSEERKPRRIRCIIDVVQKSVYEVTGRTLLLAGRDLALMSLGGALMHRFTSIFVTSDRKLALVSKSQTNWQVHIDGKEFELKRIPLGQSQRCRASFESARHPNSACTLAVATWNDGSRAFIDSRGLLHLQSSDPAIAEATLVLNDRDIAAWSSDGWVCGSPYFVDDGSATVKTAAEFEQLVLNPFIDRLS